MTWPVYVTFGGLIWLTAAFWFSMWLGRRFRDMTADAKRIE